MKIKDNKVVKLDRSDSGSDALQLAQRTNAAVVIVLKDNKPVFDVDSLRGYLDRKVRNMGDPQKQQAWDNAEKSEDPDILENLYNSIVNP